ncbi:MAG TPA: hypothetical protein VE974_14310 [Thermoanaerobaculia bacterium]|nr:hypothetical protein [Thermoanaerobaculia bacterium]
MSQQSKDTSTGAFAAASTVPVSVFNANNSAVNVIVNNGPSFQIAGISGPNYQAQLATSGAPGFTPGAPLPNTFGVGTNQVSITPVNSIISNTFTMTLPSSVQYQSLQLYVFFANINQVSWVLLQNGQILLQNISINS